MTGIFPENLWAGGHGAAEPRQRRILFVAGDRQDATHWATVLQMAGHGVRCVSSSKAALLASRQHPFEVLIVDLDSSDNHGPALARHVQTWQPMSAIALCGDASSSPSADDDSRPLRETGFAYQLAKPVTPDRLLQVLAEM